MSARNQLRGRIVEITYGGVMAEVRVAIGGQELVSIITRSSAERLGLAVGARVLAIVKSTEVMLARA
ncbi:MAG: TOBE domain-containing protein [Armatimonadetes bacterium]|nr:TOBE domain-containing protein [Armatimonadota bacterium]